MSEVETRSRRANPAPTLAALARKLDLALDERTLEFFGDSAAMKALKQDAHRLAASSA